MKLFALDAPYPGRIMFSANLAGRSRENLLAIGLSLICFCFYLSFLIRFGVMFFWGSDLVSNAAYGVTFFSDIHQAGWTVPKPAEMLIFGTTYWLTGDLWFVHLVLIVATSLTVWAGCRLILKHYASPIGCIAFCVLMMALPRMFRTTLWGGAGCLNSAFLLLGVLAAVRREQMPYRVLLPVFLSLANLTRPDSWPCTYLIIFAVLSLRFFDEKRIRFTRADGWFLIPVAMPLVWFLVNWVGFGDPLYSVNVVGAWFAEIMDKSELLEGHQRSRVVAFISKLEVSLRDLLSISSWLSLRGVVFALLFLNGARALWRKAPRTLLLISCPLVGTLMFYFAYTLRGTSFTVAYIYTVPLCAVLIASVGLDAFCGMARFLHPTWVRWTIRVGVAGVALLLLTVVPAQQRIAGNLVPDMKRNAALSKRARSAIEHLVADVRRKPGGDVSSAGREAPIILSTRWIPPSRISLALGSGKDVFLIERLLRKERVGREDSLPELEGRTVYFCVRPEDATDVQAFVQPMLERAKSGEVIYRQEGLTIVRCSY